MGLLYKKFCLKLLMGFLKVFLGSSKLRSFTNISVLILLISLPWLWPSGSFPVAPSRICENETSPRAVDMATVTVWVQWKEASEAGGEEREIGVPDCWHSWIKLPVQSACLSVYAHAHTHTRMHTHKHTLRHVRLGAQSHHRRANSPLVSALPAHSA